MSTKDLMFLNTASALCKEIVATLLSKGLRDKFLLVYVDTGRYNIPACIKQIPSLLTTDKKIIVQDAILAYINAMTPPQQQMLSTFNWEGGGFSANYSIINDEDAQGNMTPQQFTMLNESDMSGAAGPPNFKEDCTKQNKFDATIYETYIASRNKDEEEIKRQYKNANRY
jgi:hypothetical protein